jgi:hypothetical protein
LGGLTGKLKGNDHCFGVVLYCAVMIAKDVRYIPSDMIDVV